MPSSAVVAHIRPLRPTLAHPPPPPHPLASIPPARHSGGSVSSLKPAHRPRSTAGVSRRPRYWWPLMTTVGSSRMREEPAASSPWGGGGGGGWGVVGGTIGRGWVRARRWEQRAPPAECRPCPWHAPLTTHPRHTSSNHALLLFLSATPLLPGPGGCPPGRRAPRRHRRRRRTFRRRPRPGRPPLARCGRMPCR